MKCIHLATGRQLLDEIHARWRACCIKDSSGKSFQIRVLMADCKKRCCRVSLEVRGVPILIKTTALTRATAADHSYDLAVCILGARHDRALQENSRGLHPMGAPSVHPIDLQCLDAKMLTSKA
jgi:hypothetical protein